MVKFIGNLFIIFNMDVKFGKVKPNNFFLQSLDTISDENYAAELENGIQTQEASQSGHLNDYDSTILENNAYQSIPDEMFKLEHKISMLEESLSKLNNEIETLESLGYNVQVYNLKNRRQNLEQELEELNKKYSELGFSAKISSKIASAVHSTSNNKHNIFSNAGTFIAKNILSKLSKKFDYSQSIGDALSNLSNINSSVNELIQMQTPYGENINRYEKLTAYLNKANSIHAQINKYYYK